MKYNLSIDIDNILPHLEKIRYRRLFEFDSAITQLQTNDNNSITQMIFNITCSNEGH